MPCTPPALLPHAATACMPTLLSLVVRFLVLFLEMVGGGIYLICSFILMRLTPCTVELVVLDTTLRGAWTQPGTTQLPCSPHSRSAQTRQRSCVALVRSSTRASNPNSQWRHCSNPSSTVSHHSRTSNTAARPRRCCRTRTVPRQGPRRLDLLADTRTRKHNIAADAFVDARATRPPGDPGQAKLGPNERLPCASAELFKRVSAAPARAKPNTKRPLDGQPSQPSQRGRGLRGEGRGRPWDHPNQAPHTHCS